MDSDKPAAASRSSRPGPGIEGLDMGGLRMTRQRQAVYNVLIETLDHPTASEVFIRAKDRMPGISLATVYNCLETLTQAGVVKQVNVDRDASRYCPNLKEHAHFFCSKCEQVFDISPRKELDPASGWALPEGARIEHMEVAMKGVCPACRKSESS